MYGWMEKSLVALPKCCSVVRSHVGLELSLYGSSVVRFRPPGTGEDYINVQSVPRDEQALAVSHLVPHVCLCVCLHLSFLL